MRIFFAYFAFKSFDVCMKRLHPQSTPQEPLRNPRALLNRDPCKSNALPKPARRLHHRLRRFRRHGSQSPNRRRPECRAARSRTAAGSRARLQRARLALRLAASWRRRRRPRPPGDSEDEFLAPNGAWEIEGEPYVSAPGSTFRWFRSRIVGGRTNHWGRIALRMAPVDFKVRSHDGMGDDWPLRYEDVAPYYDKVESYIGVFGIEGKHCQRSRRNFPATAQAPLHRNHYQKGLRSSKHSLHSVAACDPDPAPQRPRRLSLLRAMRSRLHYRFEFQFKPGDDSSRGKNWALHPDHRRHGPRTSCGQRRQG